jgi:hypothetical protein
MKELTFRQKQNMDRQNLISDAAKIQELKRQEEIKAAAAREIANQAAIASTRNAFTDTGNSVGRSSDPGTAAAGMGGGSRQATSAGSTKSGRTDGGWGWADGGRVGYQAGGVATPEQYAAALGKVSAGTQDQQNRSLAEYVQNSLGLTQKHFDTVNQMKQNPSQFGINSQFDYAKKSGADLVKNANPFAQPFVALGQGVASPIYDYGQALKKYSDKGYQGEFGLSTQGILDFGKNLLRVGQEFAAQKPIQMALGRTLGGAEAIREGISNLFTNPSQQATTSSNPQIQQTTQNTSQTNYGSPGSIYTDSGNTYYVGKDGLPYNVTGINLENFKVQGENPDGSWYTKYNIPSSVYGLANGGLATMFSEKR